MATPDEIFVNPKSPTDVLFGQSIIVSLSGDNGDVSGSYIKTDRVGEMTHYINDSDLVGLPLINYKCFASRFIQENTNTNLVPVLSAYNTDDTVAIDLNNIESYGDRLYKYETLHQLPTDVNPPSAAIGSFGYAELQLDSNPDQVTYDISFVEIVLTYSNLDVNLFSTMYFKQGNQWVSNHTKGTPVQMFTSGAPGYPGRSTDPAGTLIARFDYTTPVSATNNMYRFRFMNTDTQSPGTIKIHHVLMAGEKI